MILMPYVQGITKSGLPFGVILLVLINTFVYFGPQSHDARRLERASIQYTESILPKVELPHYVDYLKERKETEKTRTIESLLSRRQVWYAQSLMQRDDAFMKQLRAERIITPDNENFEQWRDARTRLDSLFESSFVERFKFDIAWPSFITALTYQFLHGNVVHLFGNMLILIFIGTAVEALIGTPRFLLGYLIGGVGAAAAFWLWRAPPDTMIGASGAISAAMGMFAILFGTRRIPFFYFIIVYFDIIRAPALLALPVWLANEALQLLWLGKGNVAYDAHFGGLVFGAVIALLWRSRALAKLADDAPPALPSAEDPLIRARHMMEKQNFDAARRNYVHAAKTTEDCSVLRECWNVITLAPTTNPEYHDIVTAILRQRSRASDVNELVLQVFNHYLKNARPVPRISANTLAALAKRFLHLRRMEELERVLRLLQSVAPTHPLRTELTEQAITVLVEVGDQGRAKALQNLL